MPFRNWLNVFVSGIFIEQPKPLLAVGMCCSSVNSVMDFTSEHKTMQCIW